MRLRARWPRFYTARLAAIALALATWFAITVPMAVSRMDWVHRRWLFFMILAMLIALVVSTAYRLVRWLAAELPTQMTRRQGRDEDYRNPHRRR